MRPVYFLADNLNLGLRERLTIMRVIRVTAVTAITDKQTKADRNTKCKVYGLNIGVFGLLSYIIIWMKIVLKGTVLGDQHFHNLSSYLIYETFSNPN